MRKLVLVAMLALGAALGGCAQLQKAESLFAAATGKVVSPQAVDIAINAFDAIESVATSYINRPRCGGTVVICRDPTITIKVVAAVKAGRTDRNTLKAALRLNPSANLSLVDVYDDLQASTAALIAAVGSK